MLGMIYTKIVIILFVNNVFSLPYCEIPDFGKPILEHGVINAIFLTSSSCVTCNSQLEMLCSLLDLLEEKGIQVNLVVSSEDSLDSEPKLSRDVKFDNGTAWHTIDGNDGHIILFDQCGKLTYEVINPWSNLEYPYVLAALLSTLLDHPCGRCTTHQLIRHITHQGGMPEMENSVKRMRGLVLPKAIKTKKSEPIIRAGKDGKVPITVVFNSPHAHVGDKVTYEHTVVITGDDTYHGHVGEDSDEKREEEEAYWEPWEEDPDAGQWPPQSQGVDPHQQAEPETEKTSSKEDEKSLQAHYNKLTKWIDYPFEDIFNFNSLD